jgi:hypothetical protein
MSCITGKLVPDAENGGADVALRRVAGRDHVLLGARPPHADDLVAREAELRGRLDRRGIHDAEAPQDHVVGPELAHLQPLRLLRVAGRRDRDLGELDALLGRERVQHRDRLLAVRRVVVQVGDLLALQLRRRRLLLPR